MLFVALRANDRYTLDTGSVKTNAWIVPMKKLQNSTPNGTTVATSEQVDRTDDDVGDDDRGDHEQQQIAG